MYVQGLSHQVAIPERANVIISDLAARCRISTETFSRSCMRESLLAAGGVLIPQIDTSFAAVLETPEVYRKHLDLNPAEHMGVDFSAIRRFSANAHLALKVEKRDALLTPPPAGRRWIIEPLNRPARGEVRLTATRAGTGHGICIWFDTTLADGIGFSNAPGTGATVYGQLFCRGRSPFPWPPATWSTSSSRRPRGRLLMSWETVCPTRLGPLGTGLLSAVRFFQRSFGRLDGAPEPSFADYVPATSGKLALDRAILEQIDGRTSWVTSHGVWWSSFPAVFPTGSMRWGSSAP